MSTATTLEYIPTSAGDPKCQRPRTLMRQQSLQQPLSQHQKPNHSQPTTSQSLGQLQTHSSSTSGNPRGCRSGQSRQAISAGAKHRTAGGRSRSNPGSWDHMVGQIRNRGLDMKSFLEFSVAGTKVSNVVSACCKTANSLQTNKKITALPTCSMFLGPEEIFFAFDATY
ncbi:UNVERIFIED_CONTAM: hypothetical protein K2H54_003316 [Gekko kuhli]